MPLALNGCETWSLTLREECRQRVFENRILRRIFENMRDGNGKWKRFHDEELQILLVNKQGERIVILHKQEYTNNESIGGFREIETKVIQNYYNERVQYLDGVKEFKINCLCSFVFVYVLMPSLFALPAFGSRFNVNRDETVTHFVAPVRRPHCR